MRKHILPKEDIKTCYEKYFLTSVEIITQVRTSLMLGEEQTYELIKIAFEHALKMSEKDLEE